MLPSRPLSPRRLSEKESALCLLILPAGAPALPRSDAPLHTTFRDCAAHAVRPISAEVVERAIQLVYHLDEIADAVELVQLFT